MSKTFTVIIEQGEDGYLLGDVIELPGCHTQAKTQEELLERTKEAISLYLAEEGPSGTKFLSLQQVEIDA
jgi:predicted RNase H-like HicB family nuclease